MTNHKKASKNQIANEHQIILPNMCEIFGFEDYLMLGI